MDNEFLKHAWSAKPPERCPECKERIYDTSMHPCFNGDWTCRCGGCGALLYRVTRTGVIYSADLPAPGGDAA